MATIEYANSAIPRDDPPEGIHTLPRDDPPEGIHTLPREIREELLARVITGDPYDDFPLMTVCKEFYTIVKELFILTFSVSPDPDPETYKRWINQDQRADILHIARLCNAHLIIAYIVTRTSTARYLQYSDYEACTTLHEGADDTSIQFDRYHSPHIGFRRVNSNISKLFKLLSDKWPTYTGVV
jgi:hypothetical protein